MKWIAAASTSKELLLLDCMIQTRIQQGTMQMAAEEILAPFDGRAVGEMPVSTAADVENAIVRSQQAFQVMRKLPRFVRADTLERTAELLRGRRGEFVTIIAAEAGKPI